MSLSLQKILTESDKSVNECRFIKMNEFCVEFEVSVHDNKFSGNDQQKVYIAKQSSKYWLNKRGSNRLTEFSLCTNYDSFIHLSFIHFGIPYNFKSTLQQTKEISCVIEILFSLMYSRMVSMVVCWRSLMLMVAYLS